MQLIAPRKQQAWAASYKQRAARLIAEGRMRHAGLAALEQGKASRLWHMSDPVDALEEPDDLIAALVASDGLNFWQGSAPSYRRNILRWIAQAKRPETCAARLESVATHAAQGRKVPQY